MEPLEEAVDHVRGAAAGHLILMYGDRFWDMHDLLFLRQRALGDDGLRRYAAELGLDTARFDGDRASAQVSERIGRDVRSGRASGEVRGTLTLFIDGVGHHGGYEAESLLEALVR